MNITHITKSVTTPTPTPAPASSPTSARTHADEYWKYWICQCAGWGSVAVLFTFSFSSFSPSNLGGLATIYAWSAICGSGLSHIWRGFLKQRGWLTIQHQPPWWRIAAVMLLLGTLQTLLVTLGFAVIRLPGSFSSWSWLPSALIAWTTLFIIWTTIYFYVASVRHTRQFQAEALRLEIYAKDAELRALQAQINPHFFFNSLNSVRALIYENPNAAAQMIDQLAGVMRYALQSGGVKMVKLTQEIEAVNAYLAIEKIRFEERLRVTVQIETGLDEVLIPPMILQALVENAVKYGVERSATGSDLRIRISRLTGMIHIEVANTGLIAQFGASCIAPVADSTRLGLDNTRKRLALMMGAEATVELREELIEKDRWVLAVIMLPDVLIKTNMTRDVKRDVAPYLASDVTTEKMT